jgi:hypothetical protein
MLYSIVTGLFIIGIIFGIFQWLGWVVGVFNRSMGINLRMD